MHKYVKTEELETYCFDLQSLCFDMDAHCWCTAARVSFAVTRYGESSYRFVVTAPEPGEYGFITGWSVFHFAVDPK